MEIPIVDFKSCGIDHANDVNDFDLRKIGDQICSAFMNTGFVYLANTGISNSEVEAVNEITNQFFKLSNSDKLQYQRKVNNFGYDALGKEKLANGIPGDFKESFNIAGHAVKNENTPWPDDLVPHFSTTIIAFMEKCKSLALRIFDTITCGLNLEKGSLSSLHASILKSNNHSSLRCLYYPPIPGSIMEGQVRLAEHTDYGCMTLLFQDSIGGLQIRTRTGSFIDAVPIPDTVLVNVADLLQYWTGGKLKSTPHRIMLPSDPARCNSVRRSIAFFVHPDEDLPLSRKILPDCSADTRWRDRFGEVDNNMTVGEYVQRHFRNNYAAT